MLGQTLNIGTVAGVKIAIHWSFLLLVLWVAGSEFSTGSGLRAVVASVLLLLAVFGCVVLHELGHAMMASTFGVLTHSITLYPIGGIASLEHMPKEPAHELLIALAGPAVNVVIAVGIGSVLWLISPVWTPSLSEGGSPGPLLTLMAINIALAVFNLLPAIPMDGGRVLRAFLAMWMSRVKATRLAAQLAQVLALGLATLGFFANWMLVLIAIFVFVGAAAEARAAEDQAGMEGARVQDVMLRRVRSLLPTAPIRAAIPPLLEGDQGDLIVSDSTGTYVGVLRRGTLLSALASGARDEPVAYYIDPHADPVGPGDPLERASMKLHASGYSTIPVVRGAHLVGLLTAQNLNEWLALRRALGDAPPLTP